MINDKNLEYNMALYIGLMQMKYENTKQKRKQLQNLIKFSAIKIQKRFRMYNLKKKTRKAISIQRWWRHILNITKQQKEKIIRFKQLYYGLIILKFMRSSLKDKLLKKTKAIKDTKQNKTIVANRYISIMQSNKNKKMNIIKYITSIFPHLIVRKSALLTEHKYISKYRQYLRQKFNEDWQNYEKRLTKQLWKQINKKWVKVQDKINYSTNQGQKQKNKIYLNEQDKQVDADQYIVNKLDKIYEQFYSKMESADKKLKFDQDEIAYALKRLQQGYKNGIIIKQQV